MPKEAAEQSPRPKPKKRKPPTEKEGNEREVPAGIELPTVVKVYEDPEEGAKGWEEMTPPFDKYSGMRVKHAGSSGENGDEQDVYDFFVNADNVYLKSEMKSQGEGSELIDARFVYGMVLLGLALLQEEKRTDQSTTKHEENGFDAEHNGTRIEEMVETFSKAVAPVLLPMIDHLGALDLEDYVASSASGEAT